MGIFDRFPYSSTHEMNLDYMLGKATEIAEDMQTVTAGMAQVQAGLSAISEKTEQATQAASQAAASASSIEGSVTAAEEAAEEAQMHNESAQTWANNALTYKADCQRAATEAAASSSSAAQAATAAAASEDTVATYAQAANASAQSAANNNDSAHQYANQASASASNATFHSSNAQTAATNANTSATNAETAATNAQTAATRTAALKDDCETLHRMCTAAVDQAATEAVNAANSAAQAAATKTDVETLVESLPEDFTDLNNTVNQLSDEIVDVKSAIEKLDGGRTRNLINPANYYEIPYTGAGITATVLDDGSIKVVGTPTVYLSLILIKSNTVLVPNGSYTLTRWENDVRKSVTHSTVTNGYMPQITLSFPSDTAVDSIYKIQFESGNVGTDFIPYSTVIDYIAREDISNLEKSVGNGTAINSNVIVPSKTTFVVEHQGANLFNPTTMATVGEWVINSNGIATKESDQYTTNYGALIIPVSGITAVSVKCASPYTKIYNWFYTDDTGAIITSDTPNTAIANGYTITQLDGTGTMLWMSISLYKTTSEGYMIVEGSTPQDYQPYMYYLTIPDLKVEIKDIIKCPEQYSAVVGDTLQIFYRGLIESVYDDSYDVVIRCDIGQAFDRFYQVTPIQSDVGTHTLSVSVYSPDHAELYGTTEIVLNVVKKASSPASNKVVLYVGDSLAVGGQVPHEFKRRLTGTGGTPQGDGLGNITFIGSKNIDGVNFEGIGGWTFNLYNSAGAVEDTDMKVTCENNGKTQDDQHSIYKDANNTQWKLETIEQNQIIIIRVSTSGILPATGTLTWVSGGLNHEPIIYTASERSPGNPFWNSSENKVDFGAYANRMGVSVIDYIYVLLGWNGGGLVESSYKASVNTFINNVKSSFPNCKIILMGLEIPARNGLASNYQANNSYSDYYAMIDRVFTLNKWYSEIANETENVYFLNISGQFDSKYNMQESTRNVNTRNSTNETYQSNGVHPAYSGYMQIADACYRDFVHKLQE